MKKAWFLIVLLLPLASFAQEEMIMPSSFDEHKMILKRKDANGNFVPVDESVTLPEKAQVQKKPVAQVQPEPKQIVKKKFKKRTKEYTMPSSTMTVDVSSNGMPSTFSTTTFSTKVDTSSVRTLSVETMQDTQSALERDRTFYEECGSNDRNCEEYEVDSQGRIILK